MIAVKESIDDECLSTTPAMLAHGLSTREAALCGVFAHAYAGDHAAEVKTPFCMTASDITESLPVVFKLLEEAC